MVAVTTNNPIMDFMFMRTSPVREKTNYNARLVIDRHSRMPPSGIHFIDSLLLIEPQIGKRYNGFPLTRE
jgi:hypothetical protein